MLTYNRLSQAAFIAHNHRFVLLMVALIVLLTIALIMPGMVLHAEGVSGPSSCPGC
jgi:hypothetical protein